jgi:hypothetical protein
MRPRCTKRKTFSAISGAKAQPASRRDKKVTNDNFLFNFK